MLPALAWVAFAGALNLAVWLRNATLLVSGLKAGALNGRRRSG